MQSVFICPMHPEIQQKTTGKCPKCGMQLVLKEGLNNKHQKDQSQDSKNYTPLTIILGLLLLSSITIASATGFSFPNFLSTFMIGFFLVFSGFKLIDIRGFAHGYATYDLLAQKIFEYGYIYPFIELFFGLAMIVHFQMKAILIAEIIIMSFSGVGVMLKLAKHEPFQCACLGTFLKVPLTKITLIEDFGMAGLALIMLFLK